MGKIVYSMILLLPLVFLTSFWIKFNSTMIKYRFMNTLDSPRFNKKSLDSLKEISPIFYSILLPIYNLSLSDVKFDDIKKNSKKIDNSTLDNLKKELEILEKNKDVIIIIEWYKELCMLMYFSNHPIIFSLVRIIVNFKIKIISKEKVDKQLEDESIGLSY